MSTKSNDNADAAQIAAPEPLQLPPQEDAPGGRLARIITQTSKRNAQVGLSGEGDIHFEFKSEDLPLPTAR
jgi:hypothetical protein